MLDSDRPIVSKAEDGRPSYRASALGYCPRALYYARIGYEAAPDPEWLMRAAREGKMHEQWVIAALEATGQKITCRQEAVTLDGGIFVVQGSIDGEDPSANTVECKSMSRAQFEMWRRNSFKAFRRYAWQASAYILARKKRLRYIVKCRDNGKVLDPDFDKKVKEYHIISEPPFTYEDIMLRLFGIEAAVMQQAPPPGECDADSLDSAICKYRFVCDWPSRALSYSDYVKAGVVNNGEIEVILQREVNRYRDAVALIAYASSEVEDVRGALGSYFKAAGVRKVDLDGMVITVVDASMRDEANADKLRRVLKQKVSGNMLGEAIADAILKETVEQVPVKPTVRFKDLQEVVSSD